ncbi:MAG: hypothetical protein LBQ37_02155 [Elusimicrobiota bacterium]|jgi:predicted outer membrane repeat protein|nr:hypothetical protein [Elusimicrobiota bacterium]
MLTNRIRYNALAIILNKYCNCSFWTVGRSKLFFLRRKSKHTVNKVSSLQDYNKSDEINIKSYQNCRISSLIKILRIKKTAAVAGLLFIGSFCFATEYSVNNWTDLDRDYSAATGTDGILNILNNITFTAILNSSPSWTTLRIRGWNASAVILRTFDGNGNSGFSLTGRIATFSDLNFINFLNTGNNGVISVNGSTVTFDGEINFTNNTAETNGGAIYAIGNSSVGFIAGGDILFRGNRAGNLANDIYLDSSRLYMNAKNYQIMMEGGIKAVNGSTVIWTNDAGGSWILSGINEFNNMALFNIDQQSSITVKNASWTYINNNGVNLSLENSTMNFINSITKFTENTRANPGGAIYLDSNSQLNFTNSTVSFAGNNTDGRNSYGGAIYLDSNSQADFINSSVSFAGNNAKLGYGGAIWTSQSTITFSGRINFTSNSAGIGGAIYAKTRSIITFNGQMNFTSNTAGAYAGAIDIESNSQANFINSTVSFMGNTTGGDGGAIYISNNSQIRFSNTRAIFEGNNAASGKDIYNNGVINILAKSEVILRSGINGGGDINIENAVLRVSADNSNAEVITVKGGGVFSLVDAQNANEYSTKTFSVNTLNLNNGGALEIGIVLSSDTSDLIDLGASGEMNVDIGGKLNIRYFGQWQTARSYAIVQGTVNNWEGLVYDKGHYLLDYDENVKRLFLRALSDPSISSAGEAISGVFLANVIREIGRADNSQIYENSHRDIWVSGGISGVKINDKDNGDFINRGSGVKTGIAMIRRGGFAAGIYGGYLKGDFKDENNMANFEGGEAGIYGSYLISKAIKLQGAVGYGVSRVIASKGMTNADFEAESIRYGFEGEYKIKKGWASFIGMERAEVSHKKIAEYDKEGEVGTIGGAQYSRLNATGGIKAGGKIFKVRGYIGYTIEGRKPELRYSGAGAAETEKIEGKEDAAIFAGLGMGMEISFSDNLSIFVNGQTNGNNDYLAYGANAGISYKFIQKKSKNKRIIKRRKIIRLQRCRRG